MDMHSEGHKRSGRRQKASAADPEGEENPEFLDPDKGNVPDWNAVASPGKSIMQPKPNFACPDCSKEQ